MKILQTLFTMGCAIAITIACLSIVQSVTGNSNSNATTNSNANTKLGLKPKSNVGPVAKYTNGVVVKKRQPNRRQLQNQFIKQLNLPDMSRGMSLHLGYKVCEKLWFTHQNAPYAKELLHNKYKKFEHIDRIFYAAQSTLCREILK